MTIRAAGTILRTKENRVLFVKKADTCLWEYPGGHIDEGESAEEAAARELEEEIGSIPDGERRLLARRIAPIMGDELNASDTIDYSTFIQTIDDTFEPTLNDELSGYAWSPIDQPPEPLHPGARAALARLTMDELGVARAIIAGDLTSPQRYENMTLFAIRITGTGVAYRRGLDEFVFRNPSDYLNDDFLQRIGGLPVTFWHHKDGLTMSSDEYVQRNVGSVFIPYVKGNEVWAIVRIYDDSAAKIIASEQWSTSPAVVFRDPSVNGKVEFDDGKKLLIEGKPSLIDNISIVELGVWDKGGPPIGIEAATIGEEFMATKEEEMAADKAKNDAEEAEKARKDAEDARWDKMFGHLDAIGKRLDAVETSDKERKDAEEKAHKDAEDAKKSEEEKEKERKDAAAKKDAEECAARDKAKRDAEAEKEEKARKDAEDIRKAMADMAARLPAQMSDADHAELSSAQARADGVFNCFGKQAPPPMAAETPIAYRVRLADALKTHSKWKDADLRKIAATDTATFAGIEPQIYHDAEVVARSPATVPSGQLRAVTKLSGSGHKIIEWRGEPAAWMNQFAGPAKLYGEGGWKTPNSGAH